MPNNECPNKGKITTKAEKALADLKTVTDAQTDLEPKLKSVKDSLTAIAQDNHKN
jgi:hypothetical protein